MRQKNLSEALDDADMFLKEVKAKGALYVENTVLPVLRELAFKADEAAGSGEMKDRYFSTVNALKDVCVQIGHPNTLKEASLYKRVHEYFPLFVNPLSKPEGMDREP